MEHHMEEDAGASLISHEELWLPRVESHLVSFISSNSEYIKKHIICD